MRQAIPAEFWKLSRDEAFSLLEASPGGLSSDEAVSRVLPLSQRLGRHPSRGGLSLFLAQFTSPIMLLLLGASGLSFFLLDAPDAVIILGILAVSAGLGFWQEQGAVRTVEKLLESVRIQAEVLRDGVSREIPLDEVVSGDIALLAAGDSIPGDALILEAETLFVNEASLTGETFPVEKHPWQGGGGRDTAVFLGTHVVGGSAKILVVNTGIHTEYGKTARHLAFHLPETEFERGVHRFGNLLLEATLMLVIVIFAINVFYQRPVLDALMFSLALAVGLTPQLLPAIISVNLAHGARAMLKVGVITKRLAAIENFGSMQVLFSDKTGTLTEGKLTLLAAVGANGQPDDKVAWLAALNARFEAGYRNPIDQVIRQAYPRLGEACEKLDEVPYDFVRRRLSVLVACGERRLIVTKGAFSEVVAICRWVENRGVAHPLADNLESLRALVQGYTSQGHRVLAVAFRNCSDQRITAEDEHDSTFAGLLVFEDPLKPEIPEIIQTLEQYGVRLAIITGDNAQVATSVARSAGLRGEILTGEALQGISDEALVAKVALVSVFAEVSPIQKERIISVARKAGYVVGYMGDGINDAPALRASDVAISVDGAVDVAKEAADIVLVQKDLGVLLDGIREGRRTFANTLKYVFMATSANFGNMASMAGASLLLPFLPLLPKQILLLNVLTDLPEMAIATDTVDPSWIQQPHRWNIHFIQRFMVVFGLLSSVFDYLAFGFLIALRSSPELFRTGWFLESAVSASLVVLVIRSQQPLFSTRAGNPLLTAILLVDLFVLAFPAMPFATWLGFQPLPLIYYIGIALIVLGYLVLAEWIKAVFFRSMRP